MLEKKTRHSVFKAWGSHLSQFFKMKPKGESWGIEGAFPVVIKGRYQREKETSADSILGRLSPRKREANKKEAAKPRRREVKLPASSYFGHPLRKRS